LTGAIAIVVIVCLLDLPAQALWAWLEVSTLALLWVPVIMDHDGQIRPAFVVGRVGNVATAG
jgi:hypothetical protein